MFPTEKKEQLGKHQWNTDRHGLYIHVYIIIYPSFFYPTKTQIAHELQIAFLYTISPSSIFLIQGNIRR